MKKIPFLFFLLVVFACKQSETSATITAQKVIDLAIEKSCAGNCDNSIIRFSFRKNNYQAIRSNGRYEFTRIRKDSLVTITDVLSNDGLKRYMNELEVVVEDSLISPISDGVNSVFYFSQLPYGLNDPAVKKELLADVSVNDEPYYSVKVTFRQKGGGTDFDDEFMYWVHKTNHTVDYLAYSYAVNGGGIRFREAYNAREIGGIRFVDYRNFKPTSLEIELEALPRLFEYKGLELLSTIETEGVQVSLFPVVD
jgi:hypothetical protein